ncbi:hypothetical protein BDV06DRAFT_193141 [Aspergillus oleicola]
MAESEIKISVERDLSSTPYACTSLTQLSGGTANFVYRGLLSTPLPDGTTTVIIKHAEEYLASNREFVLSAKRCLVEESALRSLEGMHSVTTTHSSQSQTEGQSQKYQVTVKTPKLYHFIPQSYTQIMEDLPDSIDLKTFMRSPGVSESISRDWATSIGQTLGTWLKSFHVWINDPRQGDAAAKFGEWKVMRDLKFAVNYEGLLGRIEEFLEILEGSRGVFEEVRDMAKRELEQGLAFAGNGGIGIGAIHGDFWSGNVLIPKSSLSNPLPSTPLLITDWEMSQIGPLALDLAQMIAELYMLKLFKDINSGIWIIHGFVSGYSEAGGSDWTGIGIDEEMAFRILIHVGVHLVFWGSTVPGWGDEEQVKGVVEVGRDLIVKAWGSERSAFEGDEVWGVLFSK